MNVDLLKNLKEHLKDEADTCHIIGEFDLESEIYEALEKSEDLPKDEQYKFLKEFYGHFVDELN